MASRQEEKEARRKARLEQEASAARTAARQKRLQLVAGGALAAVIVVGVVVAILSGGGSGGSSGPKDVSSSGLPKLPGQQVTDVDQAAKAAGCTLTHPQLEGRGHESRTFTEADYKTNPPTSGVHFPEWSQDGSYEPANTPPLGELVHTLEHGRIDIQYKPGTPQSVVDQLQALVNENGPYHMLLFQNPTKMTAQIAATAWGQSLTCGQVSDKTWDALRSFRDAYIDKGPEKIP